MRTGIALSTILDEVKMASQETTNATQSTYRDPAIKLIINQEYRWLANEFRWPLRHDEVEVPVGPGAGVAGSSNVYVWPSSLNPAFISDAWVKIGTTWIRIYHGIGRNLRSFYTIDTPSWPVERYEFKPDDGSGVYTFEVIPSPSEAGVLRFSGQEAIADLIADTDKCLIDADVLVFRAASKVLARKGAQHAVLLNNSALSRARKLLQGMTSSISTPMNHSRRPREQVPWEDYIPPGLT